MSHANLILSLPSSSSSFSSSSSCSLSSSSSSCFTEPTIASKDEYDCERRSSGSWPSSALASTPKMLSSFARRMSVSWSDEPEAKSTAITDLPDWEDISDWTEKVLEDLATCRARAFSSSSSLKSKFGGSQPGAALGSASSTAGRVSAGDPLLLLLGVLCEACGRMLPKLPPTLELTEEPRPSSWEPGNETCASGLKTGLSSGVTCFRRAVDKPARLLAVGCVLVLG
mmetsp:Transcript_18677/g.32753  ORF Transcript_18677/g.32753 Transcript_18677/m.32753 type:complete len:227 (-) Transcript_18677:794-1474(-)